MSCSHLHAAELRAGGLQLFRAPAEKQQGLVVADSVAIWAEVCPEVQSDVYALCVRLFPPPALFCQSFHSSFNFELQGHWSKMTHLWLEPPSTMLVFCTKPFLKNTAGTEVPALFIASNHLLRLFGIPITVQLLLYLLGKCFWHHLCLWAVLGPTLAASVLWVFLKQVVWLPVSILPSLNERQ